ncbi:HpcH/HpaI aldolase family protein [Roseiterribacter gracilis]|uniref:2,4-dihydroxyhept-2-ene-1,7-dioic acid aldolase n=1 Tax=Roseiterribacter gracilis TaxID=2812848 RepID=A0A8S8XAK2_9PROT|nr:2,4-dihydroxyhept-2-ene-1,7-dioic acid aldolase [Rhodospirillales bacterium TMPK1]
MRSNRLRALHAERKLILSAWLSIPSSYAAEVIAHLGFDAVTIDLQHGMIGFDAAVPMLQAISTSNAIPLVRPSRNDPAEIMKLLDAGAYGVICPMISTREDAERLVSTCRYPPTGTRSFGPARGLLYGGMDYLSGADKEMLVLAMIETEVAIANLDAIVATPGLDGIFIGPNDLALALGRSPKPEHDDPFVIERVEHIRKTAAAKGLMTGIFCSGPAGAVQRVQQGFDLITPGNDVMFLRNVLNSAMAEIRGAKRPEPSSTGY